jgi:signal peptidase I
MSDHKPTDGEKPDAVERDTADADSSAAVTRDRSSDDIDLTPEAEFAASESDQPPPVVTSDTRRPIWSDAGDAPFDDSKEKIPAAAKVRVKGEKDLDDRGGPSAASETVEIVKTVVVALALAFVLRVLLFQPFTIPSASMEPNLYEGDYIVVSKWAYGYSKYSSGLPINLPLGEGRVLGRAPNRGDIVVFKLPRDNKTDYIKRVIGLPGDRIQMIANKLHINGQPVGDVVVSQGEVNDIFGPRPVTQVRETLPNGKSFLSQDYGPGGDLDDTPVYEVPAGHYFMMGDNRDNSIDSRVQMSAGVGMVPEANLVGKAEIIMFSWEPGASLFNPVSWFANVRPSRFFRVLD